MFRAFHIRAQLIITVLFKRLKLGTDLISSKNMYFSRDYPFSKLIMLLFVENKDKKSPSSFESHLESLQNSQVCVTFC